MCSDDGRRGEHFSYSKFKKILATYCARYITELHIRAPLNDSDELISDKIVCPKLKSIKLFDSTGTFEEQRKSCEKIAMEYPDFTRLSVKEVNYFFDKELACLLKASPKLEYLKLLSLGYFDICVPSLANTLRTLILIKCRINILNIIAVSQSLFYYPITCYLINITFVISSF